MGTAARGVHQAPDSSEAYRSSNRSALKDRRTTPAPRIWGHSSFSRFCPQPKLRGSIPLQIKPASSAASLVLWLRPGLEGRWPAFCLALLLSRRGRPVSLTLNALHTVRAIAVMTAGTSHYHYLWFLNTSCYKSCLPHRGRRLRYCITAPVLKPDFLLRFQPGQVPLKKLVSNLSGFSIGIFSPLCPFLVILYKNASDFTSFSTKCIIPTGLPRPLAFHYQGRATATEVPVSGTTLFSHSATS